MIKIFLYICQGAINYLKYQFSSSYRKKMNNLFSKREKICNNCMHINDNKCSICECFIPLKTKVIYKLDKNNLSIDGCPIKKW